MERLSLSSVVVIWLAAAATASAGESNPNMITKTFRTSNGMFGVASIAGVTSRNGRVSSVSSVKLYPSHGHDMAFAYPNAKSTDKIPEPITFSKEENGRITSGSIKYGPSGSVSVSSSARSAYPAGSAKFPKPMMSINHNDFDDMFFPYPLTTFNSRSFDPWFPNEFPIRQPAQPRFDAFKNGWPYPSFSPFNYW